VATLTVQAFQEDALFAMATAAFTAPRSIPAEHRELVMPTVPPPAECEVWPPPADAFIPLNGRYESRWAIGPRPGADPPDGPTEVGGWLRTEDARAVDHLLLAAFTDAWVPPIFVPLGGPMTGGVAVPTVELGVHFRSRRTLPLGAYVLGVFRSRTATGGFVEEDGELWSEDGELLAQSRQLSAMVPVSG
jgi:acyl-CoA thioesterase